MKENNTFKPIFIVACPRSGTTVLASILNKHPNIATSSETHFFNYLRDLDILKTAFQTGFTQNIIKELYSDTRFNDYCNLAEITEAEFWETISTNNQSSIQLTEKDFFKTMANSLLNKRNKNRFLDKTPQHLRFVKEILGLYPEAKFINITRDGRDCVNSLLKMPWRPSGIVNNARFWNYYIKLASKLKTKVSEDSLISIRYEDLVKEPKNSLRNICRFIEEDFDSKMLDIDDSNSIFAKWESDWKSKANDELDASRAGAWKEELCKDDAILLNTTLANTLLELGYEVDKANYKAELRHHFELFIEYIRLAGKKLLRF